MILLLAKCVECTKMRNAYETNARLGRMDGGVRFVSSSIFCLQTGVRLQQQDVKRGKKVRNALLSNDTNIPTPFFFQQGYYVQLARI